MIRFMVILAFVIVVLSDNLLAGLPKSAYVVNSIGENLSMINLDEQYVISDAEPLGLWTNQLVVKGNKAYVINSGSNEIQVIDLYTLNTIKNIDVGTGTNPYAIDFVNDSIAVVSLLIVNQVAFVNVNTEQVIKNVNVGSGPEGIIYTDGRVYVANSGFNGVGYDPGVISVIDISSYSVSDISVGINPQDLDVDINGNLIIACTGDYSSVPGQMYVIDTSVDTVLYSIVVDNAITAVVVNSMNKAYLGSFGFGILVYDLDQRAFERDVENSLPGGPGMVVDAQDNIYITDFAADSVYVYSSNNMKSYSYLVGDGPISVAIYDPDSDLLPEPHIDKFVLYQNFPNPFNPPTHIKFELPHNGMVNLKVFNILGESIISLIIEEMVAGPHEIIWDGKDENKIPVPSGIYFYQLRLGEYRITKKMQIIR